MDYFTAFSWPYSNDTDVKAKEFFESLQVGIDQGHEFPIDRPHEISLVRAQGSGDLFVGVLVLLGTEGDDSLRTYERLKEWFEACRAGGYQDYESLPVRGRTTQSTLGSGYEVLATTTTPDASREGKNEQTAKGEPSGAASARHSPQQGSGKPWWKFWA